MIDWIAHGLLDSVVDSFFPILNVIEREVKVIESIVSGDVAGSDSQTTEKGRPSLKDADQRSALRDKSISSIDIKREMGDANDTPPLSVEKVQSPNQKISFLIYSAPNRALISFARIKHVLVRIYRVIRPLGQGDGECGMAFASSTTLQRMAITRRVVTSLTRLLASKSDVIAQIRKRLLTSSSIGLWHYELGSGDENEVGIYMGDVHGTRLSIIVL